MCTRDEGRSLAAGPLPRETSPSLGRRFLFPALLACFVATLVAIGLTVWVPYQRDLDLETTPEERSVAVWESLMFESMPRTIDLLDPKRMAGLKGVPVHIVQGRRDNLCLWPVAKRLADALEAAGSDVHFNLIEKGAHSPYHPDMMDALIKAVDLFK